MPGCCAPVVYCFIAAVAVLLFFIAGVAARWLHVGAFAVDAALFFHCCALPVSPSSIVARLPHRFALAWLPCCCVVVLVLAG
jgi:hypothetical protein